MAILSMNKIQIFGLSTERKPILEELQKSEIVEIDELDQEDRQLAQVETTQNITQINHYMNTAQQALSLLDEYAPEKTGFFSSRRTLSMSKFNMESIEDNSALKQAYRVVELADKVHEHKENLRRIDAKQIGLLPYLPLDVPMEITQTRDTDIRCGLVPGQATREMIQGALAQQQLDGVHFEIISEAKEQSAVWFVYLKKDADTMNTVFSGLGFQEPAFSLSHHVPKKKMEVLEQAKKDLEKQIEKAIKEIQAQEKYRRDMELLYDHLAMRKQRYQELAKLGYTQRAFVLEGYVPKKYTEKIKDKIEGGYAAYVELSEPKPGEAPVMFKNNGFVAPVEGITETYSMPSSADIDPNPIMSFFYYFFFGMMFSDAGYGLLMAIGCLILGYGKVLEPSKRRTFKMFFFCGVSTIFWGLMYGGFFGDATYTISSVFFGGNTTMQPLWIDPTAQPLLLLIFSVMLGILQILIGMGIKFYMVWRQKKKAEAIMDTGIWMWIMACIFVLALGMYLSTAGVVSAPYAAMNSFGLWGLIAGLVGLVCTQGRSKKNILMKIFGGVISIYDITGYIGDMLSYARLLALGLATGVIANVINLLGSLFGNSPVGIIFFIFVFIFGHIVNFAINALGAYVHTMRLQYVEFYGKFYEGGGRKFVPFHMDTKYYRFSKE